MADRVAITSLGSLVTPATGDELIITDVSDTTDGANGTTKKITRDNLIGSTLVGLEGVTASAAELNILDGVTATASELNVLDGITATVSELNILDGVTSTTAELNILDGVTATASELNVLDGITATVSELNILDGVTANASEINKLDGLSGAVVGTTDTQTLKNKTITSSTIVPKVWFVQDGTDRSWTPGDAGEHDITSMTLTITTTGTYDIMFEGVARTKHADTYGYNMILDRGGSNVYSWEGALRAYMAGGYSTWAGVYIDENVAAGTYTYKLQYSANGSISVSGTVMDVCMKITLVDKQ